MRAALIAGVVLLAAGACQSGSIKGANNDPGNERPGSGGPSGPGGPGGGSSGPGSSGGGNSPGSPPVMGGGPTPGPGYPLPDAGASADGGTANPGSPGCQVTITPLNPPRLLNLLAGSTAKLRVQAQVTGAMAPATPVWQWQVQLGPLGDVAVTKLTPEGDTVEFPLAAEGNYSITATAGTDCKGTQVASARRPSDRVTVYWARISPPRSSRLPTQESPIQIGGGSPLEKAIALSDGMEVPIDPRDAKGDSIRSYIRISSPQSSVRFEGNNLSGAFMADLNQTILWDVLIVPEGTDAAPVLLVGRSVPQLQVEAEMLKLDPGLPVVGTIQRTQAGVPQPVTDARVFLRAGNLPSSIGRSKENGTFELWARDGAFQMSVFPAPGSGLPEARLPDGTSYSPVTQVGPLQLTYAALDTAAVEVSVRSSDGQRPVPGARVRLDADPTSLGNMGVVGSFRLPPDDREVPAVGALRVEATTGATGAASFARLPVGRYRALVAPPAEMTDAATTVATVEVRAAMAPATVTLARPVKLTGRLLPAALAAGLKLLAIEADGPNPGEALAATVDVTGQFTLPVAPGRSYRLQIEPAQDRKLPRLFLGPHTAGVADSFYGELTLSEGVPFVGRLTTGTVPVRRCRGPDLLHRRRPRLPGPDRPPAGHGPATGRDPHRHGRALPGAPARPGPLGPVIVMTNSSSRPVPVFRGRAGERRADLRAARRRPDARPRPRSRRRRPLTPRPRPPRPPRPWTGRATPTSSATCPRWSSCPARWPRAPCPAARTSGPRRCACSASACSSTAGATGPNAPSSTC